MLFGRGRDDILQAIDEERSLHAAASALGMSYRAAWGRLKASEKRMGIKLVEIQQNKRMKLTPQARAIIEHFEKLEQNLAALLRAAEQDFRNLIQIDER